MRGDRVQLQQVVLNLILNAVEAMSSVEEGARELSISTEQDQTGDILVAVQDSGPGIDPENLERVFAPFYTTKASGLGMGLSICRSIVAAHGGRCGRKSMRPRGAMFQFTLPAGQDMDLFESASSDWSSGTKAALEMVVIHRLAEVTYDPILQRTASARPHQDMR